MAQRIVLLGFDSFDWGVARPLLARGELPNLKRLIEEGVHGTIHTLEPSLSPMLWNSIATGKRASEHGIHGFTEVDEESGRVRPATSLSRRCKAIWNIFEQNGRACQVVNWFASHPAEPLRRGAMVSDRFADSAPLSSAPWPLASGAVHPLRLAEELAELRVRLDEIDGDLMRLFVKDAPQVDQRADRTLRLIAEELAKAYSVHGAATHLLRTEPWDFAAVYWRTPDILSHHFMPFHPPAVAGADPAKAALYGDVVNSIYRMFDLMIAAYVALAGPEANIVVVSDHGFQSGPQRPPFEDDPFAQPELWHRHQGMIVLHGPAFRRGETVQGAGLLDLAPTLLAASGLPVASDMPGRVLVEALAEPPVLPPIESWEKTEGPEPDGRHVPGTHLPPEEDDRLLRQFVQLGYIDPLSDDRAEAAEQCRRQNRWNLARDLHDQGRPFLALREFESLRAADPASPIFARYTADCLRRVGLVDEARAVLEPFLDDARTGPSLLLLHAELAADGRARADALRRLEALRRVRAPSVALLLRLGDTHYRLGQFEEARRAYEDARRIDPEAAWALQGLAQVFLRQRFWELAATHAFEAIQLHHNLPVAHHTLGLALERLGHHREAAVALRAAVAYAPLDLGIRRVLIRLLAMQNASAEERVAEESALEAARAARERMSARFEELRGETKARHAERETSLGAKLSAPEGSALQTPAPAPARLAPITVVTGLPRSGTSLMMRMLQAGGMPIKVDAERPADDDNPDGYFEWQAVKRLPLQPDLIDEAAGQVVKVISMLVGHLPRDERHDYRFIFMRRPADEVKASQQVMIRRRHGEDAETRSDAAMTAEYLRKHGEQTLAALERAFPGRVLVVDYPELVAEPAAGARRLADFLGAERLPHFAAMTSVVRPELHRHRV